MAEDPRFYKGIEYFNEREFFEAHEVWEDLWVEAHGKRHAFLQGLIQISVAMHHASNQNWKGARKLCASALGYLEKAKGELHPLDLEELKNRVLDIELALQDIDKGGEPAIPIFQLKSNT